jgi:hypothetical protein
MYACVTNKYLDESFIMDNAAKLIQASFLPYVIVVTFKQGIRHDMFTSAFALWKFFFNVIDASYYMDQRFNWIQKFMDGLAELQEEQKK